MKLISNVLHANHGHSYLSFFCTPSEMEYLETRPFQSVLRNLCEYRGDRMEYPVLLVQEGLFIAVQGFSRSRFDNELVNFTLLCLREKGLMSTDEITQVHAQVETVLGSLSPLEKILPWLQNDCPELGFGMRNNGVKPRRP